MEKTTGPFENEVRPDLGLLQRPNKKQIAILGFGLCLLGLYAPVPLFNRSTNVISESGALKVQEGYLGELVWAACAGVDDIPGSECGHIIVPTDYFDESAGTTKIALGRLQAASGKSKGTVFFNPGGPGGAGKPFVTKHGDLLQRYIGEDYDVVGFDPRGIGETRPKTQCFNELFPYVSYRRNTILERSYDFALNATLDEIRNELLVQQREADPLLKTMFDVCYKSMGEELKYMGTSTVVRDIDFMTKKIDGPDALINYYGGSYGTILGQYLVNMLPDRVGRVAIDGVADAVGWSEKPSYQWYRQWLGETENNYDQFVEGCSKSGPRFCALAHSKGEDPSEIKARIESFINKLYYEPLSVSNATYPGVLTSGRVRLYIEWKLLSPSVWPHAAFELAAAINGDGSHVLNAVQPSFYRDLERSSVSCNDNAPFLAPSPEEVVDELLYVYQNVSRFVFSVVTSEPDAGCQYWPVTPPERFQGPWNNTLSNPILILSNTNDPVTPKDSAVKVQDRLGDSARLLLQDGPGHCTLALPSMCTASYVRAFFSNGTLPDKGTVCQPDVTPFPDPDEILMRNISDEESVAVLSMQLLNAALVEARSNFHEDHPAGAYRQMADRTKRYISMFQHLIAERLRREQEGA